MPRLAPPRRCLARPPPRRLVPPPPICLALPSPTRLSPPPSQRDSLLTTKLMNISLAIKYTDSLLGEVGIWPAETRVPFIHIHRLNGRPAELCAFDLQK